MIVSTTTLRDSSGGPQISAARIAFGIFLIVLAIYVVSSPGRIDIIDGQARFDVAYNWLHSGQPLLTDPWIKPRMAVPGRHKLPYSYYGAPASVLPMPLMAIGALYDKDMGVGASQFLFSLTSPILGATICTVLFLFYIELGVEVRHAFAWALVSAFATMIWPLSNSTFDNAQHAFFAILSVFLGFVSSRHNSKALAIAGGLSAAVLVLYQEYFLIIIPALAMSTIRWTATTSPAEEPSPSSSSLLSSLISNLRTYARRVGNLLRAAVNGPGEERASCVRFVLWSLTAVTVGLTLCFWFNDLRFGSLFRDGKLQFRSRRGFPMFGNPVAGLATLILSPGKSIFLYSPTLVIAVIGMRRLFREQQALALGLCSASIALVLFISCISFAGGDWCWGPRYLVPLLPLWALAFPFALNRFRWKRLIPVIVGISFAVQLMAVSVENQRFFFQRGFNDFFWAEDPWVYFKDSALLARAGETISLKNGAPVTAEFFNSIPAPNWYTYTILGPNPNTPRRMAPVWMTHFKIFYLPKPWPLWMSTTDPGSRPINLQAWLCALIGMVAISLTVLYPLYKGSPTRQLAKYSGVEQKAAV